VRLSAIGDVLHALPAVAALRRELPGARLGWLVEDKAASVLAGHPDLAAVHVLPRKRWQRSLRAPWLWPRTLVEVGGFLSRLHAARYDGALDLQGNLKSGLLTALSGAPVRYGGATADVREGNAFFTNRHVPAPRDHAHRITRHLGLLAALLGRDVAGAPVRLPRPDEARAEIDAALRTAGLPSAGYAILHPGTSGFGAFKRWPAERFAALSDRLAERGIAVALTYGPGEEDLVARVRAASHGAPIPLPTSSLAALSEAIRRACVFVAADTGPLHVAAAVGTPLVGLFGPKDPRIYGPMGPDAATGATVPLPVVVAEDVPCRPCVLRRCPEPVCMTSIEVDAVLARVREALGPKPGRLGART